MSRILPIKNGLDDRFINQTDVITENALEQVINGQGGGGQKAMRPRSWVKQMEVGAEHGYKS